MTMQSAREYISTHELKSELTKAVQECVDKRSPRPLSTIAALLTPAPQVAPAPAGRQRFFIGGNWKCAGSRASIVALVEELNGIASQIPSDVEVVIFPSMLHLDLVSRTLHPPFVVGAQNCWDVGPLGDYTGCVTARMLADYRVSWVLLGHSDRRNMLGESSKLIADKCAAALKEGMNVNLTVGETEEQRANGEHLAALEAQMAPVVQALAGDADGWQRIVLAYEPVWAIGNGATPCTPMQAQEVHNHLREFVRTQVSEGAASGLRIVYTGSVSTSNCTSFVGQADIDGFVCGRASLVANDLLQICRCKENRGMHAE